MFVSKWPILAYFENAAKFPGRGIGRPRQLNEKQLTSSGSLTSVSFSLYPSIFRSTALGTNARSLEARRCKIWFEFSMLFVDCSLL